MRRAAAIAQPIALTLLVLGAAAVVALALAAPEAKTTVVVLLLLMMLAAGVWRGQPTLTLITLLFFTAPLDVSKALVPPLERFYSPGLYISPTHLLLLALGAVWALQRLFVQRQRLPFTRLDAMAAAFLCVVWVGALRSQQGMLAIASAVAYSLAVLAFYVVSHVLDTPQRLRLALGASAAVLLLELVWTAGQVATRTAFALPGAKAGAAGGIVTFGGTESAFRPTGFFIHPNALAHHMSLILLPALALTLMGPKHVPKRVWWVAAAVLVASTLMLLLSLSRGGWAAVVLGGLMVVAVYTRQHILSLRQLGAAALGAMFALAATIAVYPSIVLRLTRPDDRSTESRILLTDQALNILKHHPWLGVGFGDYNRAAYEFISPSWGSISTDYQQMLLQLVVHNHYLLLAVELGVPATLFFAWMLWRWVCMPWPLNRWQEPATFALAIGLAAAMLAQMLFLSSDNYYADIRVFLIWLTAGLLQALCLHHSRSPHAPIQMVPPRHA
jgi:O-antigen ligase